MSYGSSVGTIGNDDGQRVVLPENYRMGTRVRDCRSNEDSIRKDQVDDV